MSCAGLSPAQSTWSAEMVPGVSNAGCVMLIVACAKQFLKSVMAIVIVPAPALKKVCELNPGAARVAPVVLVITWNVYGIVPPEP